MKKQTKKTQKKIAVKKTALPKPKIKITIKKQLLGKAPEEKTFYLSDGRKLRTIYELVDELETMNDDMFRHYVNDIDNHFANWIEHVFCDKGLAEELRHIHNRIDTQRAILKHLVRELTKLVHE